MFSQCEAAQSRASEEEGGRWERRTAPVSFARLRIEHEADPIGRLIEATKTGVLKLGDKDLPLDVDQALSVIRELRRIAVPDAKGVSFTLNLPPINTAVDIDAALGIVIAEVAAGKITADEADALGRLLETRRKSLETVELERRVAAMEARQAGR